MNGPIVVGTDGSDTAAVAVATAIDLARTFGQPLHVVSAFRPVALPANLPTEFQGSITPSSAVESVLDDVAARARVAGVEVTTHAETGSPAEAVLGVADRVGAGMIVVGNKGITSKARYVRGNVPSKVAHHAQCSTFVVQTA
jgi:nucleotide-binding universal stress UspA family protein